MSIYTVYLTRWWLINGQTDISYSETIHCFRSKQCIRILLFNPSCHAKSRQTERKSVDRQLNREKKRGGNASRISTNEKWVPPVPTLIFLSPLFSFCRSSFLAKHDPAQRFVELYAMTYNLDTISHAISMQSRKGVGVPFCKWFHLDEEFIG